MGTKERRAREKEQLRRQILSAAQELLVNDGVTMLLIDFPDFPWTEKDKLINPVIHTTIEGLKA